MARKRPWLNRRAVKAAAKAAAARATREAASPFFSE